MSLGISSDEFFEFVTPIEKFNFIDEFFAYDICKKAYSNGEAIQELESLGWSIKQGKEKKKGSDADVYAECMSEGEIDYLIVDDGNVSMYDSVYHFYTIGGKIFEGRIENFEELVIVLKVLGYKK